MTLPLLKRPSAWLPIAMSMSALALLATLFAIYRGAGPRDPDEGPAVHIFQMLIAGQAPVVAFFLAKWLIREPRQTVIVLALQVAAAAAAVAPIVLLGLQ